MTLLNKDAIRSAEDDQYETVHVPEWGGDVRVKALSGRERVEFQRALTTVTRSGRVLPRQEALERSDALLLQLACVDEDGKRVFTREDVEWLAGKSGAALNRVATVVRRLAGLSDEDVEELVEDFGEAPSGHSSTD